MPRGKEPYTPLVATNDEDDQRGADDHGDKLLYQHYKVADAGEHLLKGPVGAIALGWALLGLLGFLGLGNLDAVMEHASQVLLSREEQQ
uniref:Uncharacterized protein n=1 Tax=Gibberella zeae TaxID=5518 RepID=A0A4E9EGS1_GIBZA